MYIHYLFDGCGDCTQSFKFKHLTFVFCFIARSGTRISLIVSICAVFGPTWGLACMKFTNTCVVILGTNLGRYFSFSVCPCFLFCVAPCFLLIMLKSNLIGVTCH